MEARSLSFSPRTIYDLSFSNLLRYDLHGMNADGVAR
jgi:hypothetical protein